MKTVVLFVAAAAVFVLHNNISLIQINLIKYALHYEMGQRFIYFSWNCLNNEQEINIEGLNERGRKQERFVFGIITIVTTTSKDQVSEYEIW